MMTMKRGKCSNKPRHHLIFLQYLIYTTLAIRTTGFLNHATRSYNRSTLIDQRRRPVVTLTFAEVQNDATATIDDNTVAIKEEKKDNRIWYKRADGIWRPRIDIEDLKVGRRLFATKLDNSYDLLDGKTGPKLFYECGVGRYTFPQDENGNRTQIMRHVNGMLRFGKPKMKASVVRKKRDRLVKLQRKSYIGSVSDSNVEGEKRIIEMMPVWVTRVYPAMGRFEITTSEEDASQIVAASKSSLGMTKVSASKLVVGQERIGRVVQVRSYGVFVDVGVSRLGLLHINTVADFFGTYIDKKKGLRKAGLEEGAEIKVSVQSNQRKRLALDFTEDSKMEMQREKESVDSLKESIGESKESDIVLETPLEDLKDDEEAGMWAEFAIAPDYGDDDDECSDYDEERDIESSLGLDFY